MLKLRRIELIGFKSFSEKAEITVTESGVTGIVGPNGCGKSNVSDAIAWVLGEQSAKSLRGEKMEDVIFNGTPHRAPMGMAEVTITLTEIESVQSNGNGNGNGNGHHNGNGNGPRDIVVQRRLYRSGESLYLINGKPCRLRDIQDIFLGTGLGPNSYAIIEQGRVGQLLSSKPSDRRGLIEEAAGTTKFKAKRKLAESRLEAAKQNLSRVNDILAEIDRQRNSLKRQAGKARRFIELRNRMRHILSAVFSTRAEMLVDQQEKVEIALALTGGEGKRLEQEIERLNTLVHSRRTEVADAERSLNLAREERSEVELEHEKTLQRIERLQDQTRTLEERKTGLNGERTRALEELERNASERNEKTAQLAGIDSGRQDVEQNITATTGLLSDLTERASAEDRMIEQLRREQLALAGREAGTRNEISGRKESMRRVEAQALRLDREEIEAREQALELQRLLASAREEHSGREAGFIQLQNQLHAADENYSRLKIEHAEAVKVAAETRTQEESIGHRLQTIGELAVQRAYSSESVQQFFNHVRGLDWAPLGILADFIEVDAEYEALVEDFLRSELQYVVVADRDQAQSALRVVRDAGKGHLDCLVLNGNTSLQPALTIEGAMPLASVMRFDDRVRHFNEYVRYAYIVESLDQAWTLAAEYPTLAFVARTGEVVRGHVVSWGEHEAHGPLSLKREIRDLDRKWGAARRTAAAASENAGHLEELVNESEALKTRLTVEVQEAEKAILTTDHRVRSLVADFDRAEQRLRLAIAEIGRLFDERGELERSLSEAEGELRRIETGKIALDEDIQSHLRRGEELRVEGNKVRLDYARLESQLAVLEERRSTASRELGLLTHQKIDLEKRARNAEEQIRQAEEQQQQTRETILHLEESRGEMVRERQRLEQAVALTTATLDQLRHELHESEARWDDVRAQLDSWKDRHNELEIEKTQVESDLRHLSETCMNELNESIEAVCLKCFETLPPPEMELREQEYRDLRERIDSMGAVNMMAVEEYQEAEDRFQFLTNQRQDLLDSIRDTVLAINEIDSVCRRQFREAFEAINAGFKESFINLFGGGHGELRLLEGAEEAEAGVEIVAQPPGKKLQNVLLLSGGEKALTALALLIALFQYRPSPFCVLDEVDAPLDEANVDRFAQTVRRMSEQTQFIVITHSKRTMETASALYGVTMEEPGISKIVSVRLN